jgi:hypothetical protein
VPNKVLIESGKLSILGGGAAGTSGYYGDSLKILNYYIAVDSARNLIRGLVLSSILLLILPKPRQL